MDLSLFHQSNLLYTQESLSRYQPGGYHPVKVGDTFKSNRYKIFHKLGWGGYSTVWLAKDTAKDQWVSLKIKTANSQASNELQNLRFLGNLSQQSLSSNYIVQLLDSFTHKGPNGEHECLVLELLGPSVDTVLADYRESEEKFEPDVLLRMSSQLLKAIKFIHGAGMCHGDISGRNIAFSCSNLSRATEEELFEVLGNPEIEPLVYTDGTPLQPGLPTQIVKVAEWTNWIDEDEEDLRLLDLGESFTQGKEPSKLAQPGFLRVPETIFLNSFDYRVDLWRAGCMIYTFIFTSYPFSYFDRDSWLVAQMVGFVESLPTEWQAKWGSMLMEESHDVTVEEDSKMSKIERKFLANGNHPALNYFLPVIQGLMRFLPSNRISAEKALDLLPKPYDAGESMASAI
ncbi:uncharacterized protein N7500_007843 [Penicillium coprophilum]|uniref:uncharacterized protein n=1 Tax=Penicillium coprophilum TaxID=36646 RepID=UPI002396EA5B|nr:uncharacterized protein N7500_007843 [Penicillium coprophilum]KAJ5158192.1 hypothetical protein N7500_007843 [Penicillium coprophilum]